MTFRTSAVRSDAGRFALLPTRDAPPLTALCKTDCRSNPHGHRSARHHRARAGPAPAPILKLKSRYRYHFRLQAEDAQAIGRLWREVADQMRPAGDMELVIDVDPIDMR